MANQVPNAQTARLRSDYRRAVAWGNGQWSDSAAAAFALAEQDISSVGEKGAACYAEVFILMARHWGVGNLRAAMVLGEGALRQLEERGEVRWAHSLGRMVGLNYVFLGDCQAGYEKLKKVAEYFDLNPEGDDEPLGIMDDQGATSSYLMFAAWQVGAVAEALARARSALERASTLGHLGAIVNYYSQRLLLCNGLLDRDTTIDEAKRYLELAEQSACPFSSPQRACLAHTPWVWSGSRALPP